MQPQRGTLGRLLLFFAGTFSLYTALAVVALTLLAMGLASLL